jgi:hypothetical protein
MVVAHSMCSVGIGVEMAVGEGDMAEQTQFDH